MNWGPSLWLVVAVALSTFSVLVPLVAALRRAERLDHVLPRSSHTIPTPRGAGMAMLPVAMGTLLLPAIGSSAVGFACAFGVLGAFDDLRNLSAGSRLATQSFLALAAGLVLTDEVFWALVAAAFIVAFVNAFNFMDGIDGISGFHAVVFATVFLALGFAESHRPTVIGGALCLGFAVAFLPWNVPRARVFLGDSGSYLLGSLIALVQVRGAEDGLPATVLLAPGLIYAADTTFTMLRRLCRGENVLVAHREHVYQQLTDAWPSSSHVRTALVVAGFSAAAAAYAWVTRDYGVVWRGVGLTAIAGTYLAMPHLARRTS